MPLDPRKRYVPFLNDVLQDHGIHFLVGVVDNV